MLTIFPFAKYVSIKAVEMSRNLCFRRLLIFALVIGLPLVSAIAEEHATGAKPAEHEEHGLPQAAVVLKRFGPWQVAGHSVGPLEITNSMVVTWFVAALI